MDTDLDNGEALASSPLNETEALMEADEDLEEEEENDACTDSLLGGGGGDRSGEQEDSSRTKSVDSNDGFGGGSGGVGSGVDETSKLLNNSSSGEPHPSSVDGGGGGGKRSSRAGSSSSVASAGGGNTEPKSPREPFSYAYHFKKKYTFRSDSVYSDVTPMSSAPQNQVTSPKNSESRDKSGSLSSLKGSQSKWVSLKKKLGKINSLSSGKSKPSSSSSSQQQSQDEPSALQQQAASVAAAHAERTAASGESSRSGKPSKSLQERRSLLQRAKTLSILPINSAPKNKEHQPKKVSQPPELFNVGGEMNLIPLEMLIDINDIKRPQ